MSKDKKKLRVSADGETAAGTKTKQQANTKIKSYFDGLEYRGVSVKTLLIRENTEAYNPVELKNHRSVYEMFKPLENLDHERFYTVVIDNANKIIAVNLACKGTLNQTIIHPREIFKIALLCSGAGVILVHNHPSGNPEPSTNDFIVTKRLVEAGEIMGIEVLDHIIIGYNDYFSFSKKRLLKNL
jgi:DNA repair protein RadC